ncbi:MAG: rRNA pseudouridine synthase [Gammaproteobacteria bacterium]|nr:rRNA pseudouridine synthase [Gammaproteobacteria bacterium]
MTEPVRLAKHLSDLLACSRRDAEVYIAGGWVSVDGKVIEQPNFMILNQKVELHEKASLKPLAPITILFNKPAGYDFGLTHELLNGKKLREKESKKTVEKKTEDQKTKEQLLAEKELNDDLLKHDALQLITVDSQASDDRSNIRPLQSHFRKLTPTLPLESAASGLVIYTQDRSVARKLIDEGNRVEQEFVVHVKGELSAQDLERLNKGFYYKGELLPAAKVSWQNENHLRIALKNVQLDQIEKMCHGVGLDILAMKRVRIGRISMSKLAVGEWRYLLGYERF